MSASNDHEDHTQHTGRRQTSTPERRIVFVSVFDPDNTSGMFGQIAEDRIETRLGELRTETGLSWIPVQVASSVFAPTNLGYEEGGHIPTLLLTIVVEPFFG